MKGSHSSRHRTPGEKQSTSEEGVRSERSYVSGLSTALATTSLSNKGRRRTTAKVNLPPVRNNRVERKKGGIEKTLTLREGMQLQSCKCHMQMEGHGNKGQFQKAGRDLETGER